MSLSSGTYQHSGTSARRHVSSVRGASFCSCASHQLKKSNSGRHKKNVTCGCLKVSVVMDSCSFGGTTNPAAQKIPECKLSHDMGCLLEQGVLTDVTLAVSPSPHHQVAAHKAILAGKENISRAIGTLPCRTLALKFLR